MKNIKPVTRFASAMLLSAVSSTTVMAQLQYYGYYEASDDRFGHFGEETYANTNYLHLAPLSNDTFRQELAQATANGQRIMLDFDAFFKGRDESNWDADFVSYANIVAPYKDRIASVFVADEPFTSDGSPADPSKGTFTTAQVEHMINVVNTNLPGAKTLVDFIPSSTDHWALPSNVDYVGTTNYPWSSPNNGQPVVQSGPTTYAQFQTVWNNTVGKVRSWAAGKDMWVWGHAQGVPGQLPNPPYGSLLAYPTATQAQWYRDILASGNNDVKGLSWFTYANEYTVRYGSSDPANTAYMTGARNWTRGPVGIPGAVGGADVGHLPALGPVHVQSKSFETANRAGFDSNVNTGANIRNNSWYATPIYPGDNAYNISGVSLSKLGGQDPGSFTIQLYKMPANGSTNLPTDGTLIATQNYSGVQFVGNDAFTFLPFNAPVSVTPGAKYVMTFQTNAQGPNGNHYFYLWARKPGPGGNIAWSGDQGASWSSGWSPYADQAFTPYNNANIEYRLSMREDFNPAIDPDTRQDGGTFFRSLEQTDWVGQAFVPSETNITGFSFGGVEFNHLSLNGGHIIANLYRASGSGTPTGSPLASKEISAADLAGFPYVQFDKPVVTDGGQYVATLEAQGGSITGDWLVSYVTSSSLPNFQGLHSMDQGATWTPITGPEDWKFRSFFQPNFSSWKNDADGPWTTDSSWRGGTPDTMDATAHFGNVLTSPHTVTVDSPHTVGVINFDSAFSYTLAGDSTITMDVLTGSAKFNNYLGNHTISAPVALAKNTLFAISPGTSLTISSQMTASPGVTLTKSGAGVLNVKNVRAAALTISEGGVSVLPNGTASGASSLKGLSINGGAVLDLNDNDLAIDYDGASPIASIRTMLQAGGLTSSSAAASNSPKMALGYRENDGGRSTFNGLPVDATSLLIGYTASGDANLDGKVNALDFNALASNFGSSSAFWINGDFNYDGVVDTADFTVLAGNFNANVSAPGAAAAPGALVPEPSALVLGLGSILASSGVKRVRRRVDSEI